MIYLSICCLAIAQLVIATALKKPQRWTVHAFAVAALLAIMLTRWVR